MAGIARVIAFEQEQGRPPKETPHSHPGYDVESSREDEVERYIEVKSLSGTWKASSAGLTDTQFRKAGSLGARFWLYVVECAETDDFRIYRIQNPADRVNQFLFDDGWSAIAEEDE